MISEFLNEEQMKLMVLGAQTLLEQTKNAVQVARQSAPVAQPEVDQGKLMQARKMLEEGKSLEEIEKEMIEAFPPPLRKSGRAAEVVGPIISILAGE